MNPKWKKKIARYSYRINIATALKEDLKEYIETKIYIYKLYKLYIIVAILGRIQGLYYSRF